MGYGYYRYIRAITNGVDIYNSAGAVVLEATRSGHDVTVKGGGAATGDTTIYANRGGDYPRINLKGSEELDLVCTAAKSIRGYWGTTRGLLLDYAANVTTVTGGGVSGDDLILKSENVNDYSRIEILGNSNIKYMSGWKHLFFDTSTEFLDVWNDGTDVKIEVMTTNDNVYLLPNGTGRVKFGTYTNDAGVVLDGYIPIYDAAGNSRLLAVVTT